VIERTGATEIHPYDHPHVIAGQGTATLDLLAARPEIGAVLAPVSGGGLLSGTAIAAHGINPAIAVYGAEPVNVDDAARSLAGGARTAEGNSPSIADGLLAVLSDRTFGILQREGVEVVTVTEDERIDAMALVLSRMKQVIEPSAAAAVAALVSLARSGASLPSDVGVIVSGGNVDLDRLSFARKAAP
jgi:threonine dehydratase